METEEYPDHPCVALVLSNAEITLVDADVYHELSALKWSSSNGYVKRYVGGGRRSPQWEHLHVRINRTPPGVKTDHRNTFKMDNRRSNLRDATHSLNGANTPKKPHKTGLVPSSRFKGVYWANRDQKWRATIVVKRKTYSLGSFTSETEAAAAYDAAARKYLGQFARLNSMKL